MKKMKLALIAVALFAIGSAFAPISKAGCEDQQQYDSQGRKVTIGVDGNCTLPVSPVCTYINTGTEQNPVFVPCITEATFQ